MADKDVSFTINATDKTAQAFASVQKNMMRIGESTTKFTALASAGGYAISGLDGLGKAGQAAAAGIGMTTMAMSALGGPAGIMLGVVAGIAGFVMTTSKAEVSTAEWSTRLAELQGNMVKVKGMKLAEDLERANAELEEISSYSFKRSVFGEYDEKKIAVVRANIAELNKQIKENNQLQREGVKDINERQRAESDLNKEREKLAAAGRAIYDATRTPLEKLTSEHWRLNSLLRQGAIDEETRSRAMRAAIETYDATLQKEKQPQQKEDDKLTRDLTGLEESLMSENERMQQHYIDQQFIAEEAFQANLITSQERQLLLEELEAQHQKKLNAIAYNGMAAHEKFAKAFRDGDVRTALNAGAQLTAGVATQNKHIFELNKALAIGDATVSTSAAVMESWHKAGGWPWGVVPAAMMAAIGVARISAISSTQFGGGGSAPSLAGAGGGGGSTVNTVPANAGAQPLAPLAQREATGPRNITITFEGIADKNSVRQLIQSINEEIGDGVNLNVA